MTATRTLEMDVRRYAPSSAVSSALLHSPTSAAQPAVTPGSLALSNATTATPSEGMDAVQGAQMLSPDGLAQLSRAVGLIACKSAETASKPLQKNAMTATRQRATAAAQGAQWSADTLALDSRLFVRLRHVVTESLQALNHATMETPRLEMGAARHVPLKWVTGAITTPVHALLPSALCRQVTRLVGMAKLLGQRQALAISVTMATRQRATAAQSDARWSVDTPVLAARRQLLITSATQHAETPFALAMRYATTATPSVGMDAVQTVLRWRLNFPLKSL